MRTASVGANGNSVPHRSGVAKPYKRVVCGAPASDPDFGHLHSLPVDGSCVASIDCVQGTGDLPRGDALGFAVSPHICLTPRTLRDTPIIPVPTSATFRHARTARTSNMTMVTLEVSQGIATITFNNPRILNAINREGRHTYSERGVSRLVHQTYTLPSDYAAFANALREADARKDVLVTIWQGRAS